MYLFCKFLIFQIRTYGEKSVVRFVEAHEFIDCGHIQVISQSLNSNLFYFFFIEYFLKNSAICQWSTTLNCIIMLTHEHPNFNPNWAVPHNFVLGSNSVSRHEHMTCETTFISDHFLTNVLHIFSLQTYQHNGEKVLHINQRPGTYFRESTTNKCSGCPARLQGNNYFCSLYCKVVSKSPVCIHVYTHTHTHIHTYIYIDTHTHKSLHYSFSNY